MRHILLANKYTTQLHSSTCDASSPKDPKDQYANLNKLCNYCLLLSSPLGLMARYATYDGSNFKQLNT